MGDCCLLGAERGGAMYLKGSACAGTVTSKRNLRHRKMRDGRKARDGSSDGRRDGYPLGEEAKRVKLTEP